MGWVESFVNNEDECILDLLIFEGIILEAGVRHARCPGHIFESPRRVSCDDLEISNSLPTIPMSTYMWVKWRASCSRDDRDV